MFFDIALLIWLAEIFAGLKGASTILVVLLTFCLIFGSIAIACVSSEYDSPPNFTPIKHGAILASILLVVSIIAPSRETSYILIGAKVADTLAENPKVKELGGKTYTLIETKLDQYIREALDAKVKLETQPAPKAEPSNQ